MLAMAPLSTLHSLTNCSHSHFASEGINKTPKKLGITAPGEFHVITNL